MVDWNELIIHMSHSILSPQAPIVHVPGDPERIARQFIRAELQDIKIDSDNNLHTALLGQTTRVAIVAAIAQEVQFQISQALHRGWRLDHRTVDSIRSGLDSYVENYNQLNPRNILPPASTNVGTRSRRHPAVTVPDLIIPPNLRGNQKAEDYYIEKHAEEVAEARRLNESNGYKFDSGTKTWIDSFELEWQEAKRARLDNYNAQTQSQIPESPSSGDDSEEDDEDEGSSENDTEYESEDDDDDFSSTRVQLLPNKYKRFKPNSWQPYEFRRDSRSDNRWRHHW